MGGPPELRELRKPARPGPGELLIEVQAAGIGPWDAFVDAGGWDVGLRPPAAPTGAADVMPRSDGDQAG